MDEQEKKILNGKHFSYFQGVLQIRDPSDEVVNFVINETKKDGKAVITRKKKVSNGFDFYFSSNNYLKAMGRKLSETFIGELKLSSRLHTQDRETMKELFRGTIFFRPLPFKKGDYVCIDDKNWRITLVGKQIQLQEEKSGKKQWLMKEKVAELKKVKI